MPANGSWDLILHLKG